MDGPFALTIRQASSDRLYDLNTEAEARGLGRGMTLSEARALCPGLRVSPADPAGDLRFLQGLRRWALRYCPWVGIDPPEGLALDISGSAHLWGGEAALIEDIRARLGDAGLELRLGLAGSLGAAWALAHFAEGIAPPGRVEEALAPLPVAALRLPEDSAVSLQRLGLHTIGALLAAPRAPLARRFGPDLLRRLDQALGLVPEPVTPLADPPQYAVRMTLPEPIGLRDDVEAGLKRLLAPLCAKLTAQQVGARALCLTLRRVDGQAQDLSIRLAAAMRDPVRIFPLFARVLDGVEAGFGIDQLRLEATLVEPLPAEQLGAGKQSSDQTDNLLTRIGTRIGLDNILRFQPNDSHLPEESFRLVPVARSEPRSDWPSPRPRPLRIFPPEPIFAEGPLPPKQFRWRRMRLTTGEAYGPERIAPEWWSDNAAWSTGVRDYWQVDTREGRRLWMFHTPQAPGWFVQGEFL